MPMRHKLSAIADRDVVRLYRQSLLQFGEAHADRYARALEQMFLSIAQFPEASPERPELNGARVRPFEAHHILYRVRKDEVVVLRVLHGRQDLNRYLRP